MGKKILWLVGGVLVLVLFFAAVAGVDRSAGEEGLRRLEEAVRTAAVTCYATEGIYPPSLTYLQEHYGLQLDDDRYLVVYEVFADNLMPDITVLERVS